MSQSAESMETMLTAAVSSMSASDATLRAASFELLASTSRDAHRFDELQSDYGTGPTLKAIESGHVECLVDDHPDDWLGLGEVLRPKGVRCVVALPVIVNGTCAAVMTVYSRGQHPLTSRELHVGEDIAHELADVVAASAGTERTAGAR
jgi:hypothetical protein